MIDAPGLLPRFLQAYPFQPATAIWRASEIAAVLSHGLPQGSGLDLGCGDGRLTSIISDYLPGRDWTGLDPDREEMDLAKVTGAHRAYVCAGAETLPFADASFDFVFSNSVLEHIPSLTQVLHEVRRVLRSSGSFVFTVPSDSFHDALRGPALPWVTRKAYLDMIDQRCAHFHYLGEDEWRSLLAEAGLSMTHCSAYMDAEATRTWETCSRFTAGLLYSLLGGRHRPIEIQRGLGLRKARAQMPNWLARLLAYAFAPNLQHPGRRPFSCWLIVARKH